MAAARASSSKKPSRRSSDEVAPSDTCARAATNCLRVGQMRFPNLPNCGRGPNEWRRRQIRVDRVKLIDRERTGLLDDAICHGTIKCIGKVGYGVSRKRSDGNLLHHVDELSRSE